MSRTSEGFHHIAMRVKDFEASVVFYTKGLGLAPRLSWGEGDSRAVMLDTGDGNYLELFAGGSGEAPGPGGVLHFALRTLDCDASVEAARAAGAKITTEAKDVDLQSDPVTPVRIAFCEGPDGEVIEFFQSATT